jgi:glutamate racemase
VLKRYLDPLMRHRIDTLILGCTHYPLLYETIQREVGSRIKLIDSAPQAVRELKRLLEEQDAFQSSERSGRRLQVFVSDAPANFSAVGSKFLGEPLTHVKVVRFRGEVTKNGRWDL